MKIYFRIPCLLVIHCHKLICWNLEKSEKRNQHWELIEAEIFPRKKKGFTVWKCKLNREERLAGECFCWPCQLLSLIYTSLAWTLTLGAVFRNLSTRRLGSWLTIYVKDKCTPLHVHTLEWRASFKNWRRESWRLQDHMTGFVKAHWVTPTVQQPELLNQSDLACRSSLRQ